MSLADQSTRLVLISAWNDSGGGFLHRLLDGHSRLAVWPFELQLGNGGREDAFSGLIGGKYRWPVVKGSASEFFDSMADDELKSLLIQSQTAKHSDFPIDLKIADWRSLFLQMAKSGGRRDLIAAYVDSFLTLWRGRVGAPWLVAHCPNIVIDTHEILADFPGAKLIQVVRDPLAGIGDFRCRHPGFPAAAYAARWSAVNAAALDARRDFPGAILFVDFADLVERREATMRRIADFLDVPMETAMLTPSWRGRPLDESSMGPFGGVPQIAAAREEQLRAALNARDRQDLLDATSDVTRALGLR